MSLLNTLHRGEWIRHVDAALARSMQHARGQTPDWVLVAAALASRAVANGHSRLPLDQVHELLLEVAADREPPELPPLDEWLAMLRESPWVSFAPAQADVVAQEGTILMLEGTDLSLRRYWNYEMRLAAAVNARLASSSDLQAGGKDAAVTDVSQLALTRRFLLLTGGPGTGKTTAVARTLVAFAKQHIERHGSVARIALAAPTGKAAARLGESVHETLGALQKVGSAEGAAPAGISAKASTVHRLLGWQRGSVEFSHDAMHPLSADLVVVDEASMIDLPLMCKLLEAVSPSATLLLIGDRDQLPSVETGDVLASLCDAALVGHRVHLTHSYRQASDIDVVALANQVRDGDQESVVAGLAAGQFRGALWQRGNDRALGDAALAQALPAYRALRNAPDVATALAAARRFRILTAVREGGAGSLALNALIASALDPLRRGDGFFHGRLVLINENNYRHNLFNGDIGLAWPDESGQMRVWFEAADGPRSWLPAALPGHESAFALTVHKSQGSEFDRVMLALPEHGARVLSRELLYTGLTRCRSQVTLWASEAVLREAIRRKAQRWSGLSERLGVGR